MIINGNINPDTTNENPILPTDADAVPTAAQHAETDEIADVPDIPAPDHALAADDHSENPNTAEIPHEDNPVITDHIPIPPHEITPITPIPILRIATDPSKMKWYQKKLHMITQTMHHQKASSHTPMKYVKHK